MNSACHITHLHPGTSLSPILENSSVQFQPGSFVPLRCPWSEFGQGGRQMPGFLSPRLINNYSTTLSPCAVSENIFHQRYVDNLSANCAQLTKLSLENQSSVHGSSQTCPNLLLPSVSTLNSIVHPQSFSEHFIAPRCQFTGAHIFRQQLQNGCHQEKYSWENEHFYKPNTSTFPTNTVRPNYAFQNSVSTVHYVGFVSMR